MRRRWQYVGGTCALLMAIGCSDDGASRGSGSGAGASGGDAPIGGSSGNAGRGGDSGEAGEGGTSGGSGGDGPVVLSRLMSRASDCDDLTTALQDEIRARFDSMVEPPVGSGGTAGGGWGGFPGTGGAVGAGGSFGAGGSGSSGTGNMGSGGAGGGSGSGDPIFTGTNTQIPGVDEPDFIKTDGEHLFILQARTLHVATARPASALAPLTNIAVEGTAREMFLAEGATADERRIAIYSTVGDPDPATMQASFGFVKLTVFRFAAGELSVERETYFEGDYVSARRRNNQVRTVLNVYRSIPDLRTWATEADVRKAELMVLERLQADGQSVADLTSAELDALVNEALVEVLQTENEAAIEAIDGQTWIPRAYTRAEDGGLVDASIGCDAFYLPASGTLELGVTYVTQLDLGAPAEAPSGAALLGATQTIYENASVLVLASPPAYSDVESLSYLHSFDVSGTEPLAYQASGSVPGQIKDQFSLDEHDGDLRVVTGTQWWPNGAQLYVMRPVETDLEIVGESEHIAPDETLRAVRFLGDRAYVVTFRVVDPLFAFDLSNPEQPQLLGELEIPGFSEYMHPIGDGHLLTIGSYDGSSANIALRLFDVQSAAAPSLLFEHPFSDWGSSAAQLDHRAFTYYPQQGLLAIPFAGWSWDENYYYATPINRMALIDVSVDQGFSELGSIDGTALTAAVLEQNGSCGPWNVEYGTRFERGTFIEDDLYAIARQGVIAASIDAPEAPLAVMPLPEVCEGGSGGVGTGGTGGFSGGVGGSSGTAGTSGSFGGSFGSGGNGEAGAAGEVGAGGAAPGTGGAGGAG